MAVKRIDWLQIEAKLSGLLHDVRDNGMPLRDAIFGIDAVLGDELKRGYVFDVIDDVPSK